MLIKLKSPALGLVRVKSYNGQKSLWPYKSRSSRFFKTPKGLVSDKRPWPYNRGNTVSLLKQRDKKLQHSGKFPRLILGADSLASFP